MTRDEVLALKTTLEHQHIEIRGKLAQILASPNGQEKNGDGHIASGAKKVFWGEDEWDFLVAKVSSLSLKEPTTGIKNLAERIMQQMPEEQRRPAHAGLVSELNKRLIEYNRIHWLDIEQDLQVAKQEIARRKEAMSREEVIASLTDEEVQLFTPKIVDSLSPFDLVSRFSEQTILDCISTEAIVAKAFINICSQAGEHTRLLEENLTMTTRLLADLPQEKIRRQLQEKPAPVRLPQVAFAGFKAEQIAIVAESLHGRIRIDVVDKNRSTFDSQADIIMLWTTFISHSFEAQVVKNMKKGARLIRFSGGLGTATKEIERALRS
jgi:phosphoserine phosphatase